MTTLDEAREMSRRMRTATIKSLDVARVLDWLIAMVEASRTVTDAEVGANARAMFDCHMKELGYGGQNYWTETCPDPGEKKMWLRYSRTALEAAAAVRA